ncbi:sigma factor-like helix-turn-helix DNA-binding protein [Actinoplanes sp. NPDC049681]|uniref:sigma factor-like helix-turn-helix DNA-binding protein n=1 Tax=Actinoplanes sp. NPDC049681 TaxID=3363905 RepID=UPI0037AD4214
MLTGHAHPVELMLRSLPAPQQEILVATYFRGRTTREAAGELGLAPAAANALLYRAMRGLSLMMATHRLVQTGSVDDLKAGHAV